MTCYNQSKAFEKSCSERVYVSWSGGKDSTAMLLRMLELGERVDDIYFANTTLEYPEMYAYINKIKKYVKDNYDKEIITLMPKDSFFKWFYGEWTRGRHKGIIRGFPRQSTHGYCCRELKINPQNLVRSRMGTVCLGIAYDEQDRKQKGNNLRYPLIEWKWTEKDCRKYLVEKDLLNPLYLKFKRTGCWLCPKQPLSSLRILFRDYPILWKRLKKLEADSPHGFRADYTIAQLEEKFLKEQSQTKLEVKVDGTTTDGIPSKTKVLGILPNEL